MKAKDILKKPRVKNMLFVTLGCGVAALVLYLYPLKDVPNSAEGWNTLACEQFERLEYDKAVISWDNAVLADPDNPDYYWRRARACRHIGRFDQSIDDVTKAIELGEHLNPRKLIYYYHTRAMNKAARGDNEGAVEDFTEAVKMAKGGIDAAPMYMERGRIQIDLAEPKKAVEDLTRVIETVPTWGRAYYYRSKAYEALSEQKLAESDYLTALKQNYTQESNEYEPLPIR